MGQTSREGLPLIHKWHLLSPPQVQASEVTSEDQDNPEVFYTVERDESGEVVCLCSDMGEAYDKIGGSPLEGQRHEGTGGEAHPSSRGALLCVTAQDPRRRGGAGRGNPGGAGAQRPLGGAGARPSLCVASQGSNPSRPRSPTAQRGPLGCPAEDIGVPAGQEGTSDPPSMAAKGPSPPVAEFKGLAQCPLFDGGVALWKGCVVPDVSCHVPPPPHL